ncbi:hypothetical protein P7C70_g6133, partial [Phenoliferia sp. Uapishka_3]
MTPTEQIVYLVVTGANRGIGFGLVTELAKDSSNLVFAGAREPAKADALNALATSVGNLKVVKVTSADEADNKAAVEEIRRTAGRLDCVIANAAIAKHFSPLIDFPLQKFRDHYEVNLIGVVALFQAVEPLLSKSPTGAGHFALISTGGSSMGRFFNTNAAAYASSKASANFIIKTIHHEYEADGIIASAHHPAWVQTDMGNTGAVANGMQEAPVKLEDSVKGILANIVGATRERVGGKFMNAVKATGNPYDVETDEIPW